MSKLDGIAGTLRAATLRARRRGTVRMCLKDVLFKVGTGVHRAVFTVSKGRILGTALGMPVVKLDTIGRKSGKVRSTMLTVPIVDGERLVLVASFGGDDRHPAWYRNLQAHPEVRATIAGSTRAMVARTASDDEKSRLWHQITELAPVYAQYQQKTERPIPVVVLEPRDGPGGVDRTRPAALV
jgi:deazaflavin-dependent oxidoreductase (nitroreductase family)